MKDMKKSKSKGGGQEFRHKHSLGQNFLTDEGLLERLADAAGIQPEEDVLEIGAGSGMLTRHLSHRARHVYAVEVDERLRPYLELRLAGLQNVTLRFDNVLSIRLDTWMREERGSLSSLRVVANIPYYITSEIIGKLYAELPELAGISMMVQAEVADKLTANAGDEGYGPLSLMTGWRYAVQSVLPVSAACFQPVPNVDSCFVSMRRRETRPSPASDEAMLFRLIRGGFIMRRKTMANNLGVLLGINKKDCLALLEAAGIAENARAEQMSLADFCRLADAAVSYGAVKKEVQAD